MILINLSRFILQFFTIWIKSTKDENVKTKKKKNIKFLSHRLNGVRIAPQAYERPLMQILFQWRNIFGASHKAPKNEHTKFVTHLPLNVKNSISLNKLKTKNQ